MYETIDLSQTDIDPEAVELVNGMISNKARTDGRYANVIDMARYGLGTLFMPVRFVGDCECKAHQRLEIAVKSDIEEKGLKRLVHKLELLTQGKVSVVYAPAEQVEAAIRENYGEELAPLKKLADLKPVLSK